MIFITTGTSRLPFGRLIEEIDRLAAAGCFGDRRVLLQYRGEDVQPQHVECVASLEFGEMLQLVREADLVIGHGGAGTLILCRQVGTPVILVARRASLGENHDDHQVDFCEYVSERGLASYAAEMDELEDLVRKLLDQPRDTSSDEETSKLIRSLHELIAPADSSRPAVPAEEGTS